MGQVRHFAVDCVRGPSLLFPLDNEPQHISELYLLGWGGLTEESFQHLGGRFVTEIGAWLPVQGRMFLQVAVTQRTESNVGLFAHVKELTFSYGRFALP
jgi:hypothetical protein